MCEGSIYVPHRNAREIERLVVKDIPGLRLKGYYPAVASRSWLSDNRLVCIRGQCEAVFKTVYFEFGLPAQLIKAWEGKKDVEVMLRHSSYSDVIRFPDGQACYLSSIRPGVRVDIGIPVERPAGMTVVDGAIREALAMPDPPEGGETHEPAKPEPKPEEPAKEPAPEQAPAAA